MSKVIYTKGEKIGNLIFLNKIESENKKRTIANFRCECGKEFTCRMDSVKKHTTKSCGCQKKHFMSIGLKKHGHVVGGVKTPEYRSWQAMHARCYNPKHQNYERYQQLNITVCDEWKTFDAFIADMGLKPSKEHTIDRIENTKGYCTDNCKWSTRKEQQRNRRDTTYIEHNGERKSIPEWAEIYEINPNTLKNRLITSKWSTEKAFTSRSVPNFSGT